MYLQFQYFLPGAGSSVSVNLVLSPLCSRRGRGMYLISEFGSWGIVLPWGVAIIPTSSETLMSQYDSHTPSGLFTFEMWPLCIETRS